jgi:PKD repeat protein
VFTHVITDLTVNFSATSQNNATFNWDFGDNGQSTSLTPTHTYLLAGTYTVTLTVTFTATGCSSVQTQTITVTDPAVGIETQGKVALRATPNPFRGTTEIGFEVLSQGLVRLEVYDMLGRKVSTLIEDRVLSGAQKIDWSTDARGGMYMVRLLVDGKLSMIRIVAAE